MMQRPNLALHPFQDVRPVWIAAGALTFAALALSALSLSEFISARGQEKASTERLHHLQARRTELTRKVEKTNRELAAVGWKKLQSETISLQEVVARRKLVWSELLVDLERALPWDVRLTNIIPAVNDKGTITLAVIGSAAGREAWLRLLATLFTDPHFSDPMPQSEETPSASNGQGYRFQLTVHYWPERRP